jgi:hypothetical protein
MDWRDLESDFNRENGVRALGSERGLSGGFCDWFGLPGLGGIYIVTT